MQKPDRSRLLRPRLAWSADAPRPVAPSQATRFREIMLPHLDAAYNYARFLTRDPHRAEDVTQDAFLRAFRSFDTWRGEAARGWLLQIVRNCFLASLTDTHRHPTEDPSCAPEPVEPHDPETLVAERDEATVLRQTIASLPEPFRETLILRELEELSYKEIAELTCVPIGTVMSRLSRARTLLAELLLPDGPLRAGVGR